MPINWNPRDPLAAEAVAGLNQQEIWAADIYTKRLEFAEFVVDTMPEQCLECGGFKADDTTPSWVFKEREICECQHLHQWNLAYHTHFFHGSYMGHHPCEVCSICSICGSYRCEAE